VKEEKNAILIMGMHRSGTSIASAIISAFGFSLGINQLPPNEENEKGFFENSAIVELNDELLRYMNLAWDSIGFTWNVGFSDEEFAGFREKARAILINEFSDCKNIVIKDPRLCYLFEFWQGILVENGYSIRCIVLVRNPLECARSQERRHDKDPDFHVLGKYTDQVLLLWYTYLRKALMAIGSEPTIVVSYEGLLTQSAEWIEKLSRFAGVTLTEKQKSDYVISLIDQNLKHNFAGLKDLQEVEPEGGFVSQLFNGLSSLTGSDQSDLATQLDRLLRETPEFSKLLPLYIYQVERLHGMAYHTGISLRHRLISSGHKVDEAEREAKELRIRYEKLESEYSTLEFEYSTLESEYSTLETQLSEILKRRTVRLSMYIQKALKRVRII
jgi:hypothetical protein